MTPRPSTTVTHSFRGFELPLNTPIYYDDDNADEDIKTHSFLFQCLGASCPWHKQLFLLEAEGLLLLLLLLLLLTYIISLPTCQETKRHQKPFIAEYPSEQPHMHPVPVRIKFQIILLANYNRIKSAVSPNTTLKNALLVHCTVVHFSASIPAHQAACALDLLP